MQGAGYVFVEPEGGWQNMTETAVLTASDGQRDDAMGSCGINASGTTIVASTPAFDSNAIGRAYVYQKPKSGWQNMTQTAELTSTAGKNTGFGAACDIGGNTVVVGAPGLQAAFVFVEPAGGWKNMTQTAELTAPNAGGPVGDSVAIAGGTVVAGAPSVGVAFAGAVFEFTEPTGGWVNMTQTAELLASNPPPTLSLGYSLSVLGRAVAAGGPSFCCGNTAPGAVYGFVEPAGGWKNEYQKIVLMASDGFLNDDFGVSVSLSGKTLVVGADQANGAEQESGAAYVFGKSQ